MRRYAWLGLAAAGVATAVIHCGGSSDTGGGGASGVSSGKGGAGATAGSTTASTSGSGGSCAGADKVCGASCCHGDDVCLFDKCVTPGKACHTANDCGPGQYCETALGAGGAGGAGGGCMAETLAGRCLDLPPVCDQNGKPDGCVPACTYLPKAGPLNAVTEWQWGPVAIANPDVTDVWATPTVGRVVDGNCDGKIDELDAPDVVFVSGSVIDPNTGKGSNCQSIVSAGSTRCHTGVLRVLDGRSGKEVWSLAKPEASSMGFSGTSVALGDVDGDGHLDILAVTGEGYVVMVNAKGDVVRKSDKPIPGSATNLFGWGGGLALADADNDGFPEIAYGSTVFTTAGGKITLLFTGAGGLGGESNEAALPTFVDLDGAADNHLELLAGRTAYTAAGTVLWERKDLADGFPAVGDFDKDGKPDVALVDNDQLVILEGATGKTLLGPKALPGDGFGGPPTVADFDGDGKPEIGVAQQNFYSVLKLSFAAKTISVLWQMPNHDLSSSTTGSSVFDFEGDGKAEVIYADECFLWVFDGSTGNVRFAAPHTSFTGTESSIVADVDGDGRAEIVMVSNGADPSASGWKCLDAANQPTTVNGVKWTPSADKGKAYRGITVFGDAASSWVGTRTLWSEHTYHVTNVCDDRDGACPPPNVYGSVPKVEQRNWTLPWLNDFRQNVQDKGLFDAPDPIVALDVACDSPLVAHVSVRNMGLASLPGGVDVKVVDLTASKTVAVAATTHPLFPGQTEVLAAKLDASAAKSDTFVAQIVIDPNAPKFRECRADNDESAKIKPDCVQ